MKEKNTPMRTVPQRTENPKLPQELDDQGDTLPDVAPEQGKHAMNSEGTVIDHLTVEEPEGFDADSGTLSAYPIDDLMIRSDHRTIYDVNRRINSERFVMNPDFQREFVWNRNKQSRLIESVLMRIPLPVFYLAEDSTGRMVVVDGLQRLTTFNRYCKDEFGLSLENRNELDGKKFSELEPILQNRIEDFNLTLYIIANGVPERARMDIFERVNGGEPLTRQQMRNCLYMGPATKFLKEEADKPGFLEATGYSLNKGKMRDREFVNRFCAFKILGFENYQGDMDEFLAKSLKKMNQMEENQLEKMKIEFRQGLKNNLNLFGPHAFRKHSSSQDRRNVINASLWDVMSTTLSRYTTDDIELNADKLRLAVFKLFDDADFYDAITSGTNNTAKVQTRFERARELEEKILNANSN